MSWHIEAVGSREAMREAVRKEAHMPDEIKKACQEALSVVPDTFNDHVERVVHFKSSGHFDTNHGGNVLIEIRTLPKI